MISIPTVETATKFIRVSDPEIQVVAGGRPMSLSYSMRSGTNKPECFGRLLIDVEEFQDRKKCQPRDGTESHNPHLGTSRRVCAP